MQSFNGCSFATFAQPLRPLRSDVRFLPGTMNIVEIREKTVPIASPIRNAYIDFSKMTLSLGKMRALSD